MNDLTKNDILINDLSSIESQFTTFMHKFKDISDMNKELESELNEARIENTSLNQKILKLQGEIENIKKESDGSLFNSLNLKERENLKIKLQNLISRIDFHLSS